MKILNKYGFTLSELMAVVVIIGIIAGIGLGSYRKSVERARFNEAVSLAHALASAADEYFYDYRTTPSSLDVLSITVKDGSVSGKVLTTKSFTYTLNTTAGYVSAERINGDYGVRVYMETGNNSNQVMACTYKNSEGKYFCESVGYTSCSSGSSCVKPS